MNQRLNDRRNRAYEVTTLMSLIIVFMSGVKQYAAATEQRDETKRNKTAPFTAHEEALLLS